MGSAGRGLGPRRAGAVPGPHGMQRSPGRAVGRWAAPARGAPCERRWSPALARGWCGGGGAPAHAGQGQGPAALAVSCCSRGAQRRHLGGLGHGARGEVREAAWCQRMALAGGSDRPLLSEGDLGVLPLLGLGRSLGFGAEGRRLQLAFCAHLVPVTPGFTLSGLGLQVLPLAPRPALLEERPARLVLWGQKGALCSWECRLCMGLWPAPPPNTAEDLSPEGSGGQGRLLPDRRAPLATLRS